MTAQEVLARCQELGVKLAPGTQGKLRVSPPPEELPKEVREDLRRCKTEILALLVHHQSYPSRPYINRRGELIIPLDCNPRYHWWAGGQSIAETLAELNAPPEVWARYTEAPYGQVQ